MSAGEPPFNPLDKITLGLTVARAMLERPVVPLPVTTPFPGAGIYAIYYTGSEYPAYVAVAEANRDGKMEWPIYIGKAIPAGGRKGIAQDKVRRKGRASDALVSGPLFKRIAEHSESIEQVENLKIANFCCRYLTVDDIWIPLGESVLINQLRPIWNLVIDGFGNHDPGRRRSKQMKSSWDVLHPGRPWAKKLGDNIKTNREILANLEAFMAGHQAQILDKPDGTSDEEESDE